MRRKTPAKKGTSIHLWNFEKIIGCPPFRFMLVIENMLGIDHINSRGMTILIYCDSFCFQNKKMFNRKFAGIYILFLKSILKCMVC